MSEKNDEDLKRTQELYDFLQGKLPPDISGVRKKEQPKLTPEQAWTVVWYLGNQYWQVTDRIERCEVCHRLFHTWQEGDCLDFGKAPYSFCGSCTSGDEYARKEKSKSNPENKKRDLNRA